jgi:hypothetical protein
MSDAARIRSPTARSGASSTTRAETIDLLAVYDVTSDRCYYVPASELGTGRSTLCLRLKPAKNGQRIGTRPAEHYLEP